MPTLSFTARPYLSMESKGSWTFIALPTAIHKALGGDKSRIPIVVHCGAKKFRTSAMPFDGEHIFMFNAQMRAAAGKQAGDSFRIEIARDARSRVVVVPTDVKRALHAADAHDDFSALAPSHRKAYIVWITSAKQAATRERRIAKCVSMVRSGERLP